jgi:hypothetical protein
MSTSEALALAILILESDNDTLTHHRFSKEEKRAAAQKIRSSFIRSMPKRWPFSISYLEKQFREYFDDAKVHANHGSGWAEKPMNPNG